MNQPTLPPSGRLMRKPGPPTTVADFSGVQIDDQRLAHVLAADAHLLCLYEGTVHGEGTVWDRVHNRLIWSDVVNRRLLAWYPDGHVQVLIDCTQFINGNAVDGAGRLWHCEQGRRCISRSDGREFVEPIITHFEGKRLNSPNDIAIAPDGSVWFTDPIFGLLAPSQGNLEEPELDHCSLYRFDPHGSSLRRMADFEQPNGLCFSPSERTLYVSDTARALNEIPGPQTGKTHEIQAFDVAQDGSLSNRRFFCHTDHGCPDGFIVDRRGWLWTTAADGIHVYSPDRMRLGYFSTPAVCANCALGGPEMRRLFIAAERYLLAIDLSA